MLRKPRAITHGLEFLMDERDHNAILISLAQDAVPVDEPKLNQLRLKLRDIDERIANYRPIGGQGRDTSGTVTRRNYKGASDACPS